MTSYSRGQDLPKSNTTKAIRLGREAVAVGGPIHQGGTGIMKALMWYQHQHKPGSKEWRPKVIINAIIEGLA